MAILASVLAYAFGFLTAAILKVSGNASDLADARAEGYRQAQAEAELRAKARKAKAAATRRQRKAE